MKALTRELNKKTEAELAQGIGETREKLRAWRFGLTGSKVKNMKEGMAMRKNIARMLTIVAEKKTARK